MKKSGTLWMHKVNEAMTDMVCRMDSDIEAAIEPTVALVEDIESRTCDDVYHKAWMPMINGLQMGPESWVHIK